MQRSWELVRELMFYFEEHHREGNDYIMFRHGNLPRNWDFPDWEVVEHTRLLIDAGFLDGRPADMMDWHGVDVRGVTWEGHEFLDSVRDPEVWRRTKEETARVSGSVGLEVLKEAAKRFTIQIMTQGT